MSTPSPAATTALSLSVLMLALAIAVVVYFIWTTLLWCTFNYAAPRIQNSLAGSPQPFTSISWPTAAVFAFLLMFLLYPTGQMNMMTKLVEFGTSQIMPRK